MKTRSAAICVLLLTLAPAAFGDFSSVVRTLQRQPHLDRVYIPFLGVARTWFRMTGHEGVHDLRLAVFEVRSGRERSNIATAEIQRLAGTEWQPLVNVRSKNGEHTAILVAAAKHGRVRMLIVSQEPDEAVVVEMLVDPDRMEDLMRDAESGDLDASDWR